MRRRFPFACLTFFLIQGALISFNASAQIRGDSNAPVDQRPTIHQTGNGVPLVNIQTPTAAGVSRNSYSQFDVDHKGAILNNSRTDTSTQLGGWVDGNPWLATGSARVILNEVNSTNPSHLNGWIEVAGPSAQVVTANPAGISCNGCGFINATYTTLTTGTPILNQGALDGYRIQGGQVRIDGLGLDGRQTDAVTILARSAEINAGLWAKRVNLVTGTNEVTVDAQGQPANITSVIISPFPEKFTHSLSGNTASPNDTPVFALDVTHLGGMYAGHIFLVGSEHGLGVRHAGRLQATQQLTLRSDGWLVNHGEMTATDLALQTAGSIENTRVIAAQRDAHIETASTLTNTGTMASQQSLTIHAETLTNNSNVSTDRSADRSTTSSANATHPRGVIDGQTVVIHSATLHNPGEARIYGDDLALQIGGSLDNRGVIDGQTVLIDSATLHNQSAGRIYGDDLALRIEGSLDNRGVIDGKTVFIDSATLHNQSTGRIYGNDLALQADTLINAGETVNDIAYAPVIAARNHLSLGVGTLDNRDSALIVSGGDLSIGRHVQPTIDPSTGQKRFTTTGHADRLNNDSATIEVMRHAFVDATAINNRNIHLSLTEVPEAPFSEERIQVAGSNSLYLASQCRKQSYFLGFISFYDFCSAGGRQESFEDYTLYKLTGIPTRSQLVSSKPSVFRVGGDLQITGNGSAEARVTNQDSQIIAGGDIDLTGTALNNHETKGSYRVQYSGTGEYTTVEHCGGALGGHCRQWHGKFAYHPAPEVTTIDLPTGQRYTANSTSTHASGSGTTTDSNPTESNLTVTIPALPGATDGTSNALFTFTSHPESSGGYLIETDPRFANYRQWLSSDYLLDGLALDPALMQKRLGDGFYEQALVRDQVAQLSGRRWLPGYADDEAQYLALMNNGKAYAEAFQLTPGIALSAEQMAQLTTDMVWLVEQEVTLPDGRTTKVLVPKVYARAGSSDLDTEGTLIAGRSVNANLKGDLTNSGAIAADQAVTINAEDIHNLAGSIEGRDVALAARVDINNIGGRIAATDSVALHAGRDLNIHSTTQTTETALSKADAARGSHFNRTEIDRVAGVYVTGPEHARSMSPLSDDNSNTANASPNVSPNANPNARANESANANVSAAAAPTLTLSAGRNVTLTAAQVQNSGSGATTIVAGEHLTLATVTTAQDDYAVKDAKNHSHIAHREEVGTEITTTGDLTLQAGQDLTLRAATVTSSSAIDIQAGNDARIEAGQASRLNDQARQTTKRGTFSRTTTTTRDVFDDTATISTTVSGQRVTVTAGNDVVVQGSNVVADQDVTINAGRDLHIVASTNTHTEDHYRHQKKSGVFGSGGAGVTVGKRTQSTDQQTDRTTSSASTIGSLGGDIDLQAGRTYTQTGSDVIALTQNNTGGNVTITAEQVNITEARETRRTETETRFKQSGVTVAVSAPVITAIQTVDQMSEAAGNTGDPRMKALAAANAVMAVDQAVDAINKNPDQLGGVSLSVSVGSSKAQSQSTLTTDTSAPSRVIAANDITITATEDNLTIQGSQLKAGNTVTLQAEDQINVLAARDSAEQHSTNSNKSASVGVSFAVGTQQTGVSLNVAASRGRGHADGSDVHWVNAEVIAGQQIQTNSGTDTTIRGGVLSAPQVTVKVGTRGQGDLTIESLQDTSRYDSEQQQRGASVSVPIAGAGSVSGSVNATDSRINSDYASVVQQSGIRAGDGGFEVSVNGDTTLIGGAITSTQSAIDENRNTFETKGTLTTTDIDNRAVYDASSVGVNIGAGYSAAGKLVPQGTGVGIGNEGNAQYSTTQAAISDIAGNKAARTGDTETGLANNFDAAKVQQDINAQVQITQTFGTYAAKAIGDYADSQLNQARSLKVQADQLSTDPHDQERAQQLRAQAQEIEGQWGEGGSYRIALHTAAGGLTGGVPGALGGAAIASAEPLLNGLQTSLSKSLKDAGVSDELADGIAKGVTLATAAGLGAVVGDASGNGLAGAAVGANVDANNRQLHPTEIQWIKEKSEDFAKKLYGTEKPTSQQIAQAQQYLVYAGLGNINDGDQKANVLQGMHKDENYIEAKKFLHNQPDVFINDQGRAQRVFTVQGGEFYDPLKYSQYNADPAYRDFMWTSAGLNYAPPANASTEEKKVYEQRESERLARDFKGALPGFIPGVMAVGTGVVLNRTPAVKSATDSKPESTPAATTVTADKTGSVGKVGAKEEGVIVRNFAEGAAPNLSVNFNQQNKHIVGTNEYKTAGQFTQRSPLASDVDPQILVNQHAGTGQAANKVPLGQPGSVERIKSNQIVGTYFENGVAVGPTKNFTIRYGKDGVHIIPARP